MTITADAVVKPRAVLFVAIVSSPVKRSAKVVVSLIQLSMEWDSQPSIFMIFSKS